MHAGEFFRGLEYEETPQGLTFHKGFESVDKYPEQMFVWVQVDEVVESDLGCPCDDVSEQHGIQTPIAPNDLVKSLRFEAHWKRGFDLRPADVLTVEVTQPDWPEWRWTHVWLYVLTIQTDAVPLGDHLVISVFYGDDEATTALARFSGGPEASPPFPDPYP
jgi:hypothetical protein